MKINLMDMAKWLHKLNPHATDILSLSIFNDSAFASNLLKQRHKKNLLAKKKVMTFHKLAFTEK